MIGPGSELQLEGSLGASTRLRGLVPLFHEKVVGLAGHAVARVVHAVQLLGGLFHPGESLVVAGCLLFDCLDPPIAVLEVFLDLLEGELRLVPEAVDDVGIVSAPCAKSW